MSELDKELEKHLAPCSLMGFILILNTAVPPLH